MRYSQWRLIASLVGLMIYLFLMFPLQAIIISVALIAGYILFVRLSRKATETSGQRIRRLAALDTARIYLSPYKDIWRNLKLSNKHCSIKLGSDGLTITAREHANQGEGYRTFRVVSSKVHAMQDLWDMFCLNFDHNKTYDGLVSDCKLYQLIIKENVIGTLKPKEIKPAVKPAEKIIKPVEKTDVNNASEIELTALPGISIVMAKKIIKKREEIGGFKNTNDFFSFLKLKPHMEEQLKFLVCVNKMKGSLNIERYSERSVDL